MAIRGNRKRILRIRPFSMANFSGGYGYMPVFAMLAMIVSFPATLTIWAGMAHSPKQEDGTIDYGILKRRLDRILLPICIAAFALCFALFTPSVLSYGGNFWAYAPAIAWGAGIPTIGIYWSLSSAAKRLHSKGNLLPGKWGGRALAKAAALLAIGYLLLVIVFVPLGGALEDLFR